MDGPRVLRVVIARQALQGETARRTKVRAKGQNFGAVGAGLRQMTSTVGTVLSGGGVVGVSTESHNIRRGVCTIDEQVVCRYTGSPYSLDSQRIPL